MRIHGRRSRKTIARFSKKTISWCSILRSAEKRLWQNGFRNIATSKTKENSIYKLQSCNISKRCCNFGRKIYIRESSTSRYVPLDKPCGVRISVTTKRRHVILDFNMVSELITFESKGRFGKEKHQNLGVKVKVVA